MRRFVFTIAAAISLILCLTTVGLRAYLLRQQFIVHWYSGQHRFTIYPSPRVLFLDIDAGTRTPRGGFRAPPGTHWDTAWANPIHQLPLGIAYGKSPASDPTAAPYFGLVAPWVDLLILTAILPVAWMINWLWRRHRRRRAARLLLCTSCGYNLTGNTSGVCPECGAPLSSRIQHIPS